MPGEVAGRPRRRVRLVRRHLRALILIATAGCGLATASGDDKQAAFEPSGLSTEVDRFRALRTPLFSWKTTARSNDWKQGAYQIVVTVFAGQDPVWDSGMIELDW